MHFSNRRESRCLEMRDRGREIRGGTIRDKWHCMRKEYKTLDNLKEVFHSMCVVTAFRFLVSAINVANHKVNKIHLAMISPSETVE